MAQEGNTNQSKTKPFWRAIDKALAQEDGKRLRAAAEKLLDLAASGEQWAVKELADRMDGRPNQTSEVMVKGDLASVISGIGKAGAADDS